MTEYKFDDMFIINGFQLAMLLEFADYDEQAKKIVERVLKNPYEVKGRGVE